MERIFLNDLLCQWNGSLGAILLAKICVRSHWLESSGERAARPMFNSSELYEIIFQSTDYFILRESPSSPAHCFPPDPDEIIRSQIRRFPSVDLLRFSFTFYCWEAAGLNGGQLGRPCIAALEGRKEGGSARTYETNIYLSSIKK